MRQRHSNRETWQACAVLHVSTMVLSETRGLWLSWVIRWCIGFTRRLGAGGTCLQAIWMLTLEPERLKNRLATTRTRSPEMDELFSRRSSGLRFQFFCVEVFSFFPKCQCNGCNLTGQREACHGWLDAFGERGLVEVLEWARTCTAVIAAALNKPFRSWLWSLFRPRMESSFLERRSWPST